MPLGRGLYALYDNKWWKIMWKIQTWLQKYDKYDMIGLKISTKRSNLGVRGSHSSWGKNWSMKRKTSVMRVTKQLRWVGKSHGGKFDLRRPHEFNKRMLWVRTIFFYHLLISLWNFGELLLVHCTICVHFPWLWTNFRGVGFLSNLVDGEAIKTSHWILMKDF